MQAHDGFLSLAENALAVPPSVPFYPQSPTSFTGLDVDSGSDTATRVR